MLFTIQLQSDEWQVSKAWDIYFVCWNILSDMHRISLHDIILYPYHFKLDFLPLAWPTLIHEYGPFDLILSSYLAAHNGLLSSSDHIAMLERLDIYII